LSRAGAFIRRAAASDFARSGALVFGAILAGQALNYSYLLALGRTLPVADYGAVLALISVVLLVHSIGTIVQTVVAKLAADLRAAGDEARVAAFAHAILRLSRWVALGLALAVVAAQGLIAEYLHLDRPGLVTAAGIAAGVGFAVLFQRGCFQGFGTFKSFGISNLLDGGRALLVLPLTFALGAMGSMLAMLGSIAAAALYGDIVLQRAFAQIPGVARLDIRRMAVTAGVTGVSSFGIATLMFYDIVLARHFLDPVQSALYGAAALAGRVLFTTSSFLPTILLPHVALRSARGGSVARYLVAAIVVTMMVIAPIALLAAFVPELIIRVLAGVRFIGGALLVLPYVLAAAALALANVLSAYAVGRHRFGFVPYLLVIAVCEITAVVLRHGSALEIVQDVLAGHGAVCCMMLFWMGYELLPGRSERFGQARDP
jgi:O-antigen/teichoic acid export membrane protein